MMADQILTKDNLRVIFDDAAIGDLLLAAEINGAVSVHTGAVQAGDLIAEMEAAQMLLALLGRLMKPARALILQNRDRSTPAMIAQMTQIASGPDYYRVAPTKEFASGTPIVFGNDNILPPSAVVGRKDKAVSADGQRFQVRYAVVEAADILTSNKADGTAIAAYEGGAHGKLRAIAGNGRLAGLIASFERGTAAEYVRELAEDDSHGVAADAIAKFAQPVLVRVMNQEDVTENIGDISNQRGTSDLSPVEQAQNDSKRLDLGALDINDDGTPGEAAALAFIAAMPEAERNNLMDGKRPGQKAYDRLMAAVFWKAYSDAELVRLYAQSVDPEVKTILGGMASASGDLAKLEGAGELDIRGLISAAAALAVNAKRQGVKLSLFAQQADMTLDPDTMDVVRMFAENIRSAKKIGERLRAAARFAYEEFTKEDNDMFGAVEKASRAQVLAQLEKPVETPGSSLFDGIDPLLELELSGKLLSRTVALADAGEDDPMATLTISGEIIAIIQQLEAAAVPSISPAIEDQVPVPSNVIEDGPTTPQGYAALTAADESRLQDDLDSFFQARLVAVRNAMRELGWDGPPRGELSKDGIHASFTFRQVGAGANVVGMSINGIADDLTRSPVELAAAVDTTAVLTAPVTVDLNNVPSAELKALVLEHAFVYSSKSVEPVVSGKYLAATIKGTDRGIFVVDGTFDRATFKAIVMEAREAGLDSSKLSVYGRLGPYSGEGITFTNLNEFPALSGSPEPTPTPKVNMETYIKIAADNIGQLRRIDVYRVLSGAGERHLGSTLRADLATYIATNRADLVPEVTAVMAEEWPDLAWVMPSPAAPVVIEGANAALLTPASDGQPGALAVPPVPEDAPETEVPTANPARAADIAFLNGVVSQNVDMWDDDLADKIEKLGEAYAADAEVQKLWGDAIKSYTDFMVDAMSKQ